MNVACSCMDIFTWICDILYIHIYVDVNVDMEKGVILSIYIYVDVDVDIETRDILSICMYVDVDVYVDIETYDTPRGMKGWLRLVGPLKLQVPFAKEPYKRDYISKQRPMIVRSLSIVATP